MGCFCVVSLSRFRRLSGVGVVLTSLVLDWCSGMVSDGFQTQKRSSWSRVKSVQKESWLSAISIDGRQEWTCKFCSELNVWTKVAFAGAAAMTSQQVPAWEVQAAGDRRKDWRMVHGLFDVKRRGGQKVQ